MTSDATKNSSNNQNENIPEPAAPQTGPEEPVSDTNKKWNLRKFLVNLLLALILFAGIVAVSRQFYADKLQKIGWLSKITGKTQEQETSRQREIYYCPMHKKYQSDKPGNCPICSMQLVKMEKSASAETGTSQNRPPGGGMPGMPGMDMPGKSAPPPSSSDSPNTIFVSPEQQQIIGVQTAPAALRSLTKEIRTVGRVSFDETKVTHIHSKVSGWIERVFVDFVGKSVKKGDPLFTLYSPDLVSTQQEYLLALRAEKSLADSSFERVSEGARNLVEATRQRLRLWDVTEDEIRKLEKEGKAQRELPIYSPVGGVVTERAAYHH